MERTPIPEAPLRFNFVVLRYGEEVLGGAEAHARDVATRLAARGHDVRVLTTCATHHESWANELPAGTFRDGNVEVQRFRVRRGRVRPFDEAMKSFTCAMPFSAELGRAWSALQGPTVPELVAAASSQAEARDLSVLFSWLYQPMQELLPRVAARSALVPLVHDEPITRTKLARQTLGAARLVFANTEEEWRRIAQIAAPKTPLGTIVAVGRDPAPPLDRSFRAPTDDPYLLCLGRMGKARPLLPVWRALMARAGRETIELESGEVVPFSRLKLLLVGERARHFSDLPNALGLGFVSEAERWQLMRRATALLNPSRTESLSLVLLEAWAAERPVVVNAGCDVTVGQCLRSGGGFEIDFGRPEAGAATLLARLRSAAERATMGALGKRYVSEHYTWDRVLGAYESAARAIRDGESLSAALAAFRAPEPEPGATSVKARR